MGKKRDAPTLIEVMGKAKTSMSPTQADSVPSEPNATEPQREVQKELDLTDDPAPVLEVQQSRITGAKMAVAVVALSFLMAGSFWLGSRSRYESGYADGYQKARDEMLDPAIEEVRGSEPAPEVLGSLSGVTPETDQLVTGVDQIAWVKGYTYIRAQDFNADALEDARLAQDYLDRHGIETVLVRSKGKRVSYSLVTTKGFDRQDVAQKSEAERYRQRISEIGKQYFANGGRYKLDGYFVTLTRDSW